MQATLPLTRTTTTTTQYLTQCSRSRIPHLQYHIARKFEQPRKARRISTSGRPSIRYHSTAPILDQHVLPAEWTDSVQAEAEDFKNISVKSYSSKASSNTFKPFRKHEPIVEAGTDTNASSSEQAVYQSNRLQTAVDTQLLLKERNPSQILSWLTSTHHRNNQSADVFIKEATDEAFDRAFTAIDPKILIDPYKDIDRHYKMHKALEFLPVNRSVVYTIRKFMAQVDSILTRRQEAGHILSLPTLRHALQCAAAVGDLQVATRLWHQILQNKFTLDTDIYNAFLEANVQSLAYSVKAAKRFRVTSYHMKMRSSDDRHHRRPKPFRGFTVDSDNASAPGTLKTRCLTLFRQMSEQEILSDEQTFVNILLALGRSGDISGVASILKSVWNVDTALLDMYDEEEIESPTFYEPGHRLSPSHKLLYAVVHCYGANNDASRAWKLLDYISRNYNLDIPEYVWLELFNWTYVLSVPRSNFKWRRGDAEGQISLKELKNLFNTVTDEPYNLKPHSIMLNLLSRNHRHAGLRDEAVAFFRQSTLQLQALDAELQQCISEVEELATNVKSALENGMLSKKFLAVRHKFELTFLQVVRQHHLLRQELPRIISKGSFASGPRFAAWKRKDIPNLIQEFPAFIGDTWTYKIYTGTIRLREQDQSVSESRSARVPQSYIDALTIYNALNYTDLQLVAQKLADLPRVLHFFRGHTLSQADKLGMYSAFIQSQVDVKEEEDGDDDGTIVEDVD